MTTSEWNDALGITKQAVGSNLTSTNFTLTFGPVLIRYLDRSYDYFDADMQHAILDYINLQYWAITQLDTKSKLIRPYTAGIGQARLLCWRPI